MGDHLASTIFFSFGRNIGKLEKREANFASSTEISKKTSNIFLAHYSRAYIPMVFTYLNRINDRDF